MAQRRILLIDDDSDDRQLFCEALYAVDTTIACSSFAGGKEFFDHLENNKTSVPDIIFLDINLPLMNGWECLLKFKKNADYQHIPVFMYTTSSYKRDKEIAKELGAAGLVTKPTDFKMLKALLQLVASSNNMDVLAAKINGN